MKHDCRMSLIVIGTGLRNDYLLLTHKGVDETMIKIQFYYIYIYIYYMKTFIFLTGQDPSLLKVIGLLTSAPLYSSPFVLKFIVVADLSSLVCLEYQQLSLVGVVPFARTQNLKYTSHVPQPLNEKSQQWCSKSSLSEFL